MSRAASRTLNLSHTLLSMTFVYARRRYSRAGLRSPCRIVYHGFVMAGTPRSDLTTIEPMTVPLREDPPGVFRVGDTRVLLEVVVDAFRSGATPETIV